VPVASLDDVRAALRDEEPAELLGLAECGWLDAKAGVYQLDDPARAAELVKDVAAFANTETGGVLVVGISTRTEHGVEILDEIRPVPRDLVDLDRHRKLARGIIPPPRGVTVGWIACGPDRGVLFIDVPAQPPARMPHVVPGPEPAGRADRRSVAVPVREGDSTHWLPPSEIQRLLAAGWAATGGPREEVLRGLIERTVAAARRDQPPAPPAFQVAEGEPSWAPRFQEALTALAGQADIPTGPAYREGPGVAQHFGGRDGRQAWVLSALAGHKPVLVAAPVWEAVRDAGRGAAGGDALAAVGFPVMGGDIPPPRRLVPADTSAVELAGGSWGAGQLVRLHPGASWHWEPAAGFSFEVTREGRNFTGGREVPQLRIRAVTTIPWAVTGLHVTPAALRELAGTLPSSGLASAVTHLATRRGADLPAASWQAGQTRRSLDQGSLACAVTAPDGRPALTTEVIVSLPNATTSSVVTIAELRIEDIRAWRDALQAAGAPSPDESQPRLSIREVHAFLTAAWHTTIEILPAVVAEDPAALPYAWPPVTELRLSAEHPHGQTTNRLYLPDLVDLSVFGSTDRSPLAEMSVTITGPLRIGPSDREHRTRQALKYMAQGFGFDDVAEGW
jgi:hypothetical protein